jgi:hypothetical protein
LRYARQLRAGGGLVLPRWENWPELVLDSLRMLVLQLVFMGLPVLAGSILSLFFSWLLSALYLGFFAGTVAWVFLFVSLPAGLLLWMAALQRYLPTQDWARVLDLAAVGSLAWRMAPGMVIPVLAFSGLIALGWPFLGFIFFLGFGPFVAYSTAVYLEGKSARVGGSPE